ncbi:MAG: helicase RepA family protein [Acidobacteriota bacterium]|nr:helicase RepA family protein [Acidobacteriota bacterium]
MGGVVGLVELSAQAVPLKLVPGLVRRVRTLAAQRRAARLGLLINQNLESGDIEAAQAAAEEFLESRGTESSGKIEDLPPVGELGPALDYIVPEALAEGSITLLTGDSSHGKTTLVFAWMRDAIAAGRPALVLDRDCNPRERVLDRMRRIGLVDGPLLRVWGGWNLSEAPLPDSPEVIAWVKRCERPPIVLMDPFLRFLDGGDENSAVDVRATMHRGRRLANLGAGVIVSHHDGKGESSKDYRGSSDLKASVDQAFHLSNFSLDGTKLDRLTLRCYKSRYGVDGSLLYHYAGGRCVRDETPFAPARAQADQLASLLRQNPGIDARKFDAEVVKQKLGRDRGRDWLNAGVMEGGIRREPAPRNQYRYYLVEGEK